MKAPFPRIEYTEAVAILKQKGSKIEWGEDLVLTAGIIETNPKEHAVSRVPGEAAFALEYRSQDTKTLKS